MIKFGFVTCVQLGLRCMEVVYEAGASLDLVVTLRDEQATTKSGRVYVDDFCAAHGIPLLKSRHVNDDAVVEAIRDHGIDWLFIIGWSQIANDIVLAAPTCGVVGIHPTLLPQGRGRAAVPWAILKRLDRTGVTMFKLDTGVDTGPIIAQREIPMNPAITATELYEHVNVAHADLIREVIPRLVRGDLQPQEQDHSAATEWPGRTPEDGEIDLRGSVHDAECLVRAVTHPYPGAYFLRDGRRIVVWRAHVQSDPAANPVTPVLAFADGTLVLDEVEVH